MKTLKLYLVDKRNIKCLGVILVDLLPYLKKSNGKFEERPIENINGVFSIIKPPTAIENKKSPSEIGLVEIMISSEFGGNYEKLLNELIPKEMPVAKQKTENVLVSPQPPKQHPSKANREKEDKIGLSQLIQSTEQILDEMNVDDIHQDRNLRTELKIRELENDMKQRELQQQQQQQQSNPRKVPIEIEIEMYKMQKELLRSNPATNPNDYSNPKIDRMFEQSSIRNTISRASNTPKSIYVSVHNFLVEVPQFQKSLSENISFIRINLVDEKENVVETYK